MAAAGGRTFSRPDRETGEPIDNGQHVRLAGYRQTSASVLTRDGPRVGLETRSSLGIALRR